MIREATLLDLPKIFDISQEAYELAINHHRLYTWDAETAMTSMKLFILNNESSILIDEENGVVKGFMAVRISTPIAGVDVIASDVALFVKPEFQGGLTVVKLIKRYESWAKEKGAKCIELGVSSGLNHERTLSIYSNLGYRPSSVTYIKEI